jgi:uncharacterized protein (TIGR02246 family)
MRAPQHRHIVCLAVLVPATVIAIGCVREGQAVADPTPDIRAMLTHSAAAWNAGDLDGFLADYADDTTTSFMADGGPRYGFDWIRSNYAPRFAADAVRDSLRFENVHARALGPDHAMATARFVLFRDDSTTASGPFTLVLRRLNGQWKIIHDHTSSD